MKTFSKKVLLVSLALIITLSLLGCSNGSGTEKKNDDSKSEQSDYEYMIQIGDWERENAPGEVWRFGEKKVLGKSYSGGEDQSWRYYSWKCDEEEKIIETELDTTSSLVVETWKYSLSKEDTVLELTNKENGEKITLLKKGTQEAPTFPENRPTELLGFWVSEDVGEYPLIVFSDESAESGYGKINSYDGSGYISAYFKNWGESDGKLHILQWNSQLVEYTYKIDGDQLSLYNNDNTATVYTKTNIKVDGVIIN